MDKCYVPYQDSYPNLEKALKEGAKISIFRSGAGLRVVKVEKEGDLLSYGEHPYLSGALSHAETDFGLSHEEQYSGEKAKHRLYLSGAYPDPSDLMDTYVYNSSLELFYSKRWKRIICTTPTDARLNRKGEIHWGTSGNSLIWAISSCLLSFNFEDKNVFLGRVL
jgi:hypothetical protein